MSKQPTIRRALSFFFFAAMGCGGKRLDLGGDPVGTSTGGAFPSGSSGTSATGGDHPTIGTPAPDAGTEFIVAPRQRFVTVLASDGTRLYWATFDGDPGHEVPNPFAVKSCEPSNCDNTLITYVQGPGPPSYWLAVAQGGVYWERSEGPDVVFTCPRTGCSGAPRELAIGGTRTSVLSRNRTIAVDDTHLYWAWANGTPSFVTIARCPLPSCASEPELVGSVAARMFIPSMIVAGEDLFLATAPSEPSIGDIVALPKDGSGPPAIVASRQHHPLSLAADGTRVYWTNSHLGGAVLACPRTGCVDPPFVLAGAQRRPRELAVDGANAYWITPQDNFGPTEIWECPLSGCGNSPRRLATSLGDAVELAIDSNYVYWASSSLPPTEKLENIRGIAK